MSSKGPVRRVAIVDDDMMSREIVGLLAGDAGWTVETFESGEAALAALRAGGSCPEIMLVDMQMPGLRGDQLARELRAACASGVRLVAMSGTVVAPIMRQDFDDFLMKPFDGEQLEALLNGGSQTGAVEPAPQVPAEDVPDAEMLNQTTFASLRQTLPDGQLKALYGMCLDDADTRLETLRRANEARDDPAFRRAAHSIKGGCGMVGAVELARMAAKFEANGIADVHNEVPFDDFLRASDRLRGMLRRVLNQE